MCVIEFNVYPVRHEYVAVAGMVTEVVVATGETIVTIIVCTDEVPPVPVQVPENVVLAVSDPVTIFVPETPVFHVEAPFLIVQAVALVDDQDILDEPPFATDVGEAERVSVGTTVGALVVAQTCVEVSPIYEGFFVANTVKQY